MLGRKTPANKKPEAPADTVSLTIMSIVRLTVSAGASRQGSYAASARGRYVTDPLHAGAGLTVACSYKSEGDEK